MSDPNTQTPLSPGLPPVAPPSGREIVRMFIVPAVIVGGILGIGFVIYSFMNWLGGGPRTPDKFLRNLQDGNPEVRWRAAADLAQVLPRDTALAANTGFALELAAQLRRALADNRASERVRLEQVRESGDDGRPVSEALRAEREHIWYLIACLGNFQVPVGAPLLQEIALELKGPDPESAFRRRSQAVFALTVLGSNVKKFGRLTQSQREKILDELSEERRSGGERAAWAAAALRYLEGHKEALSVGDALCKIARDPSPFLRKQAAGALTYWDGAEVEDTLLALAKDDGKGDDPIVFDPKKDAEQIEYRKENPEEVRRQNARDIHYNAALTLARRGSAQALQFADLYKEMLDEKQQEELARGDKSPRRTAGDARTVQTILAALNAMDQLRAAGREVPFLPAALESLADSDNKSIRTAAKELQAKLK